MVDYATTLRLAGNAIGAFGAVLVFIEFFQIPSYVEYDPEFMSYDFDRVPDEVDEYTWFGRVGALCLALAFAVQFFATFL